MGITDGWVNLWHSMPSLEHMSRSRGTCVVSLSKSKQVILLNLVLEGELLKRPDCL